MRNCSVSGCDKTTHGKGLCGTHYARLRRTGTTIKAPPNTTPPEERFWAKVDKTPSELGCWLWLGSINSKGYGKFGQSTKRWVQSHRYSYALRFGEIPEGMQVDHKLVSQGCPRHCVNPDHLRLVTNKQNQENLGGLQVNNTSGYRGVYRLDSDSRWQAKIKHDGKWYSGGVFKTPEEANIAALRLREKYYTHNDSDALP